MYRVLLTAFVIVGVCVVMHTTVLVGLGEWLKTAGKFLKKKKGIVRDTSYVIGVFSIITFLHLLEIGIWAIFYLNLVLFEDFETSFYFSQAATPLSVMATLFFQNNGASWVV